MFDYIADILRRIFGSGYAMPVFLAALAFLFFAGRRSRRIRFLTGAGIFTLGVFFILPASSFVRDMFSSGSVYWRMFWMVPLPFVIACACTMLVRGRTTVPAASVTGILLAILIFISGGLIYTKANFTFPENAEKVPEDVILVADAIEKDAEANGITYKKLAGDDEIETYLRTCDSKIMLSHGRTETNSVDTGNIDFALKVILSGESADQQPLTDFVDKYECDYVAAPSSVDLADVLGKKGFVKIAEAGKHTVYRSLEAAEKYASSGTKPNITQASFTACETEVVFTGEPAVPKVELSYGSIPLVKDTDFTVTCINNTTPGTGICNVKGIGQYSGSLSFSFEIKEG